MPAGSQRYLAPDLNLNFNNRLVLLLDLSLSVDRSKWVSGSFPSYLSKMSSAFGSMCQSLALSSGVIDVLLRFRTYREIGETKRFTPPHPRLPPLCVPTISAFPMTSPSTESYPNDPNHFLVKPHPVSSRLFWRLPPRPPNIQSFTSNLPPHISSFTHPAPFHLRQSDVR